MTPLACWRAGEGSYLSSRSEKGNGRDREGSGENGDLLGRKSHGHFIEFMSHLLPSYLDPSVRSENLFPPEPQFSLL